MRLTEINCFMRLKLIKTIGDSVILQKDEFLTITP